MRAGEVARRAGINVETLRYYERRGLLPEPARTPSGHRRYDEDAVRFPSPSLHEVVLPSLVAAAYAPRARHCTTSRSGPALIALVPR